MKLKCLIYFLQKKKKKTFILLLTLTKIYVMNKTIFTLIIMFVLLLIGSLFIIQRTTAQPGTFCTYLQEDDLAMCDPDGNTCIVIAPCEDIIT